MSKIRCIRTSSKSARIDFDMPQSFRSPPEPFNIFRQETMVPKPVLSTNCSSLISKITLGLAVSTGAMPRLNTGDWLASSLGPGTVIIVTSPIWPIVGSTIAFSLALVLGWSLSYNVTFHQLNSLFVRTSCTAGNWEDPTIHDCTIHDAKITRTYT